MMSSTTDVTNKPNGNTMSIGWIGCPNNFTLLSMCFRLSVVRNHKSCAAFATASSKGKHNSCLIVVSDGEPQRPRGPEAQRRREYLWILCASAPLGLCDSS